jgi:selenocysteine lyase/cysteine desulfurase
VSDPQRIFFTLNTTYGLNAVIKGMVKKGDHVLISNLEHNAVYRPIHRLAEQGTIEYDVFDSMVGKADRSATAICTELARRIKSNTRLVVCTHASNICSAMMPIQEIGALCHRHGVQFVVDAAQAAGHETIDCESMHIDALCVPGHKGLYGPQGCGLVAMGENVRAETLVEGGNGVYSLEGRMPEEMPERYEAGTLPTPVLAGLAEGIRTVAQVGVESIGEHEKRLYRRAREIIGNMTECKLYGEKEEGAILLFSVQGYSAEEIGRYLDEEGICARSGHHCSALGHRTLMTPADGAVRISFGMYNQLTETERLYRALRKLKKRNNEEKDGV